MVSSRGLTVALGGTTTAPRAQAGMVCPEGVELNVLTLSPAAMFTAWAVPVIDVSEFCCRPTRSGAGGGEPLIATPCSRHGVSATRRCTFAGGGAGIAEPGPAAQRMGVPKYHMTAAVVDSRPPRGRLRVAPNDMLWF